MAFEEDNQLMRFFQWVRFNENKNPSFQSIYHIANERKATPQAGARLKKKGVRRGIPDVCVPIASGVFHGLYIEFKIKPNKLTPEQKNIANLLIAQGYCVQIAWSAEEAIKILERYLSLPAS